MPTPSIQTLVTDAQQILNLDSISAVRSVVAVALANANTGTPLNPNLTTQQLWNEFYQVVNKPKSDIESIIANQLMKLLYAPPAPGGVGADQQVIFNDGGVLAGDADFKWNKTTNLLTILGSASISNDLTVRTTGLTVNANGVGVGIVAALGAGNIQIAAGKYLGYSASSYITPEDNVQGARIKSSGNVMLDAAFASVFNIGGATGMTQTSIGLGIGVVPNANWTSYKLLQIGNGSFTNYSPTQDTGINSNIYYAGGQWYRISAAYACRYVQDGSGGIHAWFTAGTDAAGTIAALGSPKMTLTNPGDLNLAVGNVVMGTSGKGIDFSATPSGSGTMTSELFNDYEEGTFVPTVGGTATYYEQTGRYTKIGNRVFITIRLNINTLGTGDNYRILGLPFAPIGVIGSISVGFFANLAITANYISGYASTGGSLITMTATTAANGNITNGAPVFQNGSDIAISGSYYV